MTRSSFAARVSLISARDFAAAVDDEELQAVLEAVEMQKLLTYKEAVVEVAPLMATRQGRPAPRQPAAGSCRGWAA